MEIRDDQDVWRVQPEEISLVLINYYQNIFSSSRLDITTNVLAHVTQVIMEEMNLSLTHEFMESEVSTALQQMAPLKAPRMRCTPFFTNTSGVQWNMMLLLLSCHG